MAYVSSKGYYVQKLKERGVTNIDGYRLETLKTHVLYNKLQELERASKK
jgi:hypothetical protein